MPNTKIMVNWAKHKIIHTNANVGEPEYDILLKRGYIKVGTIKNENPRIFWENAHFEPKDKYIKPNNNE